ncbi:type III-A CRISPR-associated RAMP protein Csm5 [Chlorogloeopsis fritschii PCC 9212]|uniref:CRISPR system Cms protein Csm5 n=1 Tax=Chlorogloeopsis fritschii PCC 6912 TaxID=211165 RepID=A0A3S1FHI7_CHLFR|nr:type III-A CRISPR-associated RAMP protein Csm5 [Chlorogloeopsis fritschii]RUR78675.1 type III-A CRISPR-associated RAMP protein Csm5 [Chlorogloeopsis fritschii PCC 6912]
MLPSIALKKPEVYESKKIQLTSPILHIGSAVSRLNPFEYVQTSKKVYLPNQDALAKALHKKGGRYLNDYIQAISDRQDISNLLKDAFGEQWWSATDSNGELIFPKNAISQKLTDDRITDLRPMIRNGMGQLYIPGSSIKGAIRTAIAYYLLKHGDRYNVPKNQKVSDIEKVLRNKLGTLNKYQQKSADDDIFMDTLFSEYTLIYQGKRYNGSSQNTDFFRALSVSDCEPLIEGKITTKKGQSIPINLPVVAEIIVSSRFPDYLAKYRASLYVEMVRNVQTTFTVTLDTEMLSWFQHKQGMKLPFQNLDELIKICHEFSQEQWDYEHDYWNDIINNPHAAGRDLDFNDIRQFYEPEECPFTIRLGWGSGMMATTIGLCLDDEVREEIRNTCGLKAPGFEAPKSRRSVVSSNGKIKFTPGWLKLKVL